jgi:hypothetical protein
MIAAINVSSIADFDGPPFDPVWVCLHELAPEQEDDDDCEQQVDDRKGSKWYRQSGHRRLLRLWSA